MAKQLLIETGFISTVKVSNELKESLSLSAGKNDTLIVRNVPCTILNRKNQNGRIYSTQELQRAIKEAQHEIETKQLLCQSCEHPEGSFVSPTTASHCIIKAYIKQNVEVLVEGKKGRFDVLFMDWEVLNTQEGKNLRALLEAECSLGTSIRGVGDMDGDTVINYELLGVDVVSNPSSGTFTRMPVKESITLDIKDNTLNEAFTVEAETIDTLTDINAASQLLNQIGNDHTTTMTKSSLKFDSELNPDTGAETTVAILTTDTSDDVNDLQQALKLAGAKMASTIGSTDSVTISRINEEDADANKESATTEEVPMVEGDTETSDWELKGNELVNPEVEKELGVEALVADSENQASDIKSMADKLAQTKRPEEVNKYVLDQADDVEIKEEASENQSEMLVSPKDVTPASDTGSDIQPKETIDLKDDIAILPAKHKRCYEAKDFDFDFPGDLADYTDEDLQVIQDNLPDILILKIDVADEDAHSYDKILKIFADEFGLPLKGATIRSYEDLEASDEDEEEEEDSKKKEKDSDKKDDDEDKETKDDDKDEKEESSDDFWTSLYNECMDYMKKN